MKSPLAGQAAASTADQSPLSTCEDRGQPSAAALSPGERAAGVWLEMRERWRSGQRPRVEAYLASEAAADPELVLDLIYGEFALRQEHGEDPQPAEYLSRFPAYQQQLARQFAVHRGIGEVTTQHLGSTQESGLGESTVSHVPLPGRQDACPTDLPRSIGKYRVIALLGAGGQATVYRAFHPALHKDVAIKLARQPASNPRADRDQLLAEGRALAALDHPNLARVYDFDLHDNLPFLVTEYIAGQSLDQAVSQAPPTPRRAAAIVAQVARAAAAAHTLGIIHRDIKPQNILIAADGRPRLLDFGLAITNNFWERTAAEGVCGTLRFMAPEQATGDAGKIDHRCDIYGLGGVLFFLLTGQPPIETASVPELFARAKSGEWNRGALRDRRIPRPLAAICEQALATEPADRMASAADLADALERVARRARKRTWYAGLCGAGLVLLVGLGVSGAFGKLWRSPTTASAATFAGDAGTAQIPQPEFNVRVWDQERYRNLVYCMPLSTDEELRIEAQRPAGWQVSLFWLSGDGTLKQLNQVDAGSDANEITYPENAGQAVPLRGSPGTEVVFLCGTRESAIKSADVQAIVRDVTTSLGAWPSLPSDSLLRLTRAAVTVEHSARGPGEPANRPDPEADAKGQLDRLRARLLEKFEVVAGVAFSHRRAG